MENKIIFSKTNNTNEAKKLLDMGINIISDEINTKNNYKIFYHQNFEFFDRYKGSKILKIKDENDLESYLKYAKLDDCIFLIDCKNLYDCFYLFTKIPTNIKSIIYHNSLTPHIAYMAFSVGISGILCDIDNIYKNGGGKFIHKIHLSYKKSKNDRFYSKFFNAKKPFTQLRNIKIDRIFKDLNADSIALDLNDTSFKTFLYVSKNKNIIKIGIVNNKKQFKLARNLQDNAMLDVLELESSDGLDYANFAFYDRFDSNFNMQILD